MVDLTDATTGVEPIYKGAPHTLHILLMPYIAAAREREQSSWSLSLSRAYGLCAPPQTGWSQLSGIY
jgi:hypothetical protein